MRMVVFRIWGCFQCVVFAGCSASAHDGGRRQQSRKMPDTVAGKRPDNGFAGNYNQAASAKGSHESSHKAGLSKAHQGLE
ncbi:hypothetical protein CA13_26390 [Planctomycetes bacterium CA13]|uniref:Lipoprotein n=1 Tax=Novipirellula herctigrandis TaxID=2527986 RepID=A0A5C5Z2V9_9BACT|nr:hypothetical protein CA13_26390 [Planctomycetes bacterium CA13]